MTITSREQFIKEFSVSDISNVIKELLENNFGYVRIRGEISGLKIASSGHGYFNLKDNFAVLTCTCWKPILARIAFPLVDGMEVIITGKITAYAGQSRYQLSAQKIEPSGDGALMKIFNELKAQLAQEGLFAPEKKRKIPFLPNIIGIVTSITGAVIQDILHRISDRYPTRVIIWPVTVQGETAAREITEAIDGFNNLPLNLKPDVLIVARGGGSVEDLWSFNEEIVVRATYNSSIPIISAVGHETDYTLIDLAADLRAPTPTAAAEFAVPVSTDLAYTVNLYYRKLFSMINRIIMYKQESIAHYNRIVNIALNYTDAKQQRVDELGFRLKESLPNMLRLKNSQLEKFTLDRLNPEKIVHYKSLQLKMQFDYLTNAILKNTDNIAYKLNLNTSLLASLDHRNVLKRGFAIIQTEKGDFVTSKVTANLQDSFNIHFLDGIVTTKKV